MMKNISCLLDAQHPILVAVITILLLNTSCDSPRYQIDNPYQNVYWDGDGQHKANFHTHTVRSDGRLNPHVVVDEYHAMEYSILAITDHNEVTYPWTAFSSMSPSDITLRRFEENPGRYEQQFVFEDRDPESLEMIAIQSNEVSTHHHTGSFFSDFNQRLNNEEETFKALREHNSVVVLFHPGRYTESNPEKYTDGWYIDQIESFDNIIGVEIYNAGDRYPTDRALWDRLLESLMPNRQLWAFSNDDMHGRSALGRNWNVLVLPELTLSNVKEAMIQGSFYYIYAPEGHSGPTTPTISNIVTNERRATIEIEASNFNEILWISGSDTLQRSSSGKMNLKNFDLSSPYVRAEIWSDGASIAGTQPFGVATY